MPQADMQRIVSKESTAQIHVCFMGQGLQPEALEQRRLKGDYPKVVAFRPTGGATCPALTYAHTSHTYVTHAHYTLSTNNIIDVKDSKLYASSSHVLRLEVLSSLGRLLLGIGRCVAPAGSLTAESEGHSFAASQPAHHDDSYAMSSSHPHDA